MNILPRLVRPFRLLKLKGCLVLIFAFSCISLLWITFCCYDITKREINTDENLDRTFLGNYEVRSQSENSRRDEYAQWQSRNRNDTMLEITKFSRTHAEHIKDTKRNSSEDDIFHAFDKDGLDEESVQLNSETSNVHFKRKPVRIKYVNRKYRKMYDSRVNHHFGRAKIRIARKNRIATKLKQHGTDAKDLDVKYTSTIITTTGQADHRVRKPAVNTSKEPLGSNVSVTRQSKYGRQIFSEKKINTSSSAQPACILPSLDPFGEDVQSYIHDTWIDTCFSHKYSFIENNTLHIKAKYVQFASVSYIQRPNGQDNRSILKPAIDFKYTRSSIRYGTLGCLTLKGTQLIIFPQEEYTADWNGLRFGKAKCRYDYLFRFLFDGKVKVEHTNGCIGTREGNRDTPTELVILPYCQDSNLHFQFMDDGRIMFNGTHCLDLRTDIKGTVAVYTDHCDKNISRFELQEFDRKHLSLAIKMEYDFVKVELMINDYLYTEFHAHVIPHAMPTKSKKFDNSSVTHPLNVVIIMFDSQSAANFQRKLKKTIETLENEGNTVIFKGHSVIGDGTTAQLSGMFTGRHITSLPESRHGYSVWDFIDKWPLIFYDFKAKGYVTLFSEDDPDLSAFNMRLMGFHSPPTDHYSRPFWIESFKREYQSHYDGNCITNKYIHSIHFEYLKTFFSNYPNVPKFAFLMISHLTHANLNMLPHAETELLELLEHFSTEKYLDQTMLFIMGDHGLRTSDFRSTIQGKLEERLPFLSITHPPWFHTELPGFVKNLRHNSNILTSHFDVYTTLQHILQFPVVPTLKTIGISLFQSIDVSSRMCSSAGIAEHWCPCLSYRALNTSSSLAFFIAKEVVSTINVLVSNSVGTPSPCLELNLTKIIRFAIRMPNKRVQKFWDTAENMNCSTCEIIEREPKDKGFENADFEIVLSVSPGGGKFEATAHTREGIITSDENISRINLYRNQSHCIAKTLPHLKKFCYCKDLL